MPEELLTPNKSLKEIEKEKNKLVLQKFIYWLYIHFLI
jgi:hypothetical protein